MAVHEDNQQDNQPAEPAWRPLFMREIREIAESSNMLQAAQTVLERNQVTVTPSGHIDAVADHPGGMLFVGNHDRQFEFVALMDVLSRIGRTSMKNIVKFYVEKQVEWSLGQIGTTITLPVYPRILDKDRRRKFNAETGSRILFRRLLQPAEVARHLTDASLQAASAELAQGGVVNIYPCGSIANNMKKPWRQGVGRIVNQVPAEDRDEVLVVPYHANNIRRVQLAAAMAVRGSGILGRPQNIEIAFGQPQTAAEAIGTLPRTRQDDPEAITEALRQNYVRSFFGYADQTGEV